MKCCIPNICKTVDKILQNKTKWRITCYLCKSQSLAKKYLFNSWLNLTFFVLLSILSPQAGFARMMLNGSNLFLHTVVPVLATVSFLFVNAYHTIKFKTTFLAMVPVFIYAMAYLVSAILLRDLEVINFILFLTRRRWKASCSDFLTV